MDATRSQPHVNGGVATEAINEAALAVAKAWQILTKAGEEEAAAVIMAAGEKAFDAHVFGEAVVQAVAEA
ncbi:hypothetical protein LTR91_006810 [Friedmanniomyces endolithicus]|uniref:Uncharacterized protein n=1 Tax=Friedmanniomyces endolithicus TaxID=329885 RepID=A0AAN6KR11_9PEZI|nr:hypothetical protein LTR94_013501 [Friedmanniomyces endolithicus]KAK0786705.1 hypothetical protein LTR38_011909 [Friedmanniomyces endolithicus]KAK0792766.1 hypothetical protein LTR75_011355 [Friedmanniomyces endolithicus]KAK0806476.1 hypothetical protein LTR59_003553 [Friedmanniomyces endolithicus]KAK0856203.1 hypothetical protein LTS02_010731 [Friedmanniomyces endolithicus]